MKEKKWLERTGIDMNVGKVGTGENRRKGDQGESKRASTMATMSKAETEERLEGEGNRRRRE